MADGTANGTIPPPGTSIHRSGEFRKFLPDLNTPRFEALKVATAQDHVNAFLEKHNPPWLFQLWEHWRRLYQEPFRGVTTDGKSFMQSKYSTLHYRDLENRVPIHIISKGSS